MPRKESNPLKRERVQELATTTSKSAMSAELLNYVYPFHHHYHHHPSHRHQNEMNQGMNQGRSRITRPEPYRED
jgi:hypothetical protein